MSNKVYEIITNTILEKLEEGTVPWQKPWNAGLAVNWKTQKAYRGINAFMLRSGEYATFNQIKEAGGRVKKGAKSNIVVFWKMLNVEEENNDGESEEKTIPMLRYYRVFEINSQVEGLESKRNFETYDHNPIEEAEEIVSGYKSDIKVYEMGERAFYSPSDDYVVVPPKKQFEEIEKYYSTLFHEMIHSTGHKDRLSREGIVNSDGFGNQKYSKEELVAELGASMLCGLVGIDNKTIENSASYIQSWINVLKNDKKLIVQASSQAQKAVDYIVEFSKETEKV